VKASIMISRARFSLATLLIVTTIAAGGMAVWRVFFYEPPTHKIPLYERAPGTRPQALDVGPNRVGLRLIARNDRNGSIRYNQRRSAGAKLTAADEKVLTKPAKWLDVVQIKLDPGPEQIDIIEPRIFDHEKRELLPELSDAYGWRQVGPNAMQLYGVGRPLPDRLDVWFRAHSYEAGDLVAELAPTKGATCKVPGGNLTLRDIRAGSWSYRSDQGLMTLHGDRHHQVTIVLSWSVDGGAGKFQIAAVTKSGDKVHMDGAPHYLAFRSGVRSEEPINFNLPLEAIDHFEVRPFGGRHVFFFEAVELPKASAQAFAPPPKAVVDVFGKEIERELTEFAPFEITVATHRGHWASGTAAGGSWASVMPTSQATDLDEAFTFTYRGEGLRRLAFSYKFFEAGSAKPLTPADLKQRSSGTASGAAVDVGYQEFQTPLDRIESIEVSIGH
jgi:hypothetical protein